MSTERDFYGHDQPFAYIYCSLRKSTVMNATLLFLGGLGMQEIMVIGIFVLVFFGAKKIPEFMRGLGKGMREFKEGVKDVQKDIEESIHHDTPVSKNKE
jgi:sec-independent protein translocase protein TatA